MQELALILLPNKSKASQPANQPTNQSTNKSRIQTTVLNWKQVKENCSWGWADDPKFFAKIVPNSCRQIILAWWNILATHLSTQLLLQAPKSLTQSWLNWVHFKTEVPSLGKMTRLVAAAKPNCSDHCQRQFRKQLATHQACNNNNLSWISIIGIDC
jgi:hypothetical protein